MIGEKFNFEDVFFRDLTVCVLDTLEGQVKWTNRFTSGDVFVQVPIYYSLTGDERFLLDSFSDDIVSENRFVELNTDIIPRGHLTMTGFNIKSDEFANPNVWLRMVVENEVEIRKVLSKVRAVPITVNYDLTILLSSEIDTFKCSQAILDTLWIYKFMYFEHNFMNIDAVMIMPDSNSIEMSREKNLTSDNSIKLKCSFTVETYYPAFRRDRVNDTGYPRDYGSGMVDGNEFVLTGGYSDYFSQGIVDSNGFMVSGEYSDNFVGKGQTILRPTGTSSVGPGNPTAPNVVDGIFNSAVSPGNGTNQIYNGRKATWVDGPHDPDSPIPAYGQTGSFYSAAQSSDGSGKSIYGGTYTQDGYYISPKRTRWFNNILRSRERSGGSSVDPVISQQNVKPRGDEEK